MKRFHSTAQRVHEIVQQQVRLSELELAKAIRSVNDAEALSRQIQSETHAAHDELQRACSRPLQQAVIRGLLARVELLGDRLHQARQAEEQAELACTQARSVCAELQSREERLDRLIDRQRQAHRREQFKEQQVLMDEVSSSRWMNRDSEHTEEVRHG